VISRATGAAMMSFCTELQRRRCITTTTTTMRILAVLRQVIHPVVFDLPTMKPQWRRGLWWSILAFSFTHAHGCIKQQPFQRSDGFGNGWILQTKYGSRNHHCRSKTVLANYHTSNITKVSQN